MILLQLTIIAFNLVRINNAHRQVARRYEMLAKFSNLLSKIEEEEFSSCYLKEQQDKLTHAGNTAAYHINRLAVIIHRFDRRLDMILGVLLNGLFLWDIHCVVALDRWKRNSQKQIPEWFSVVKDFDATISLAGYFYNNPDFTFPGVSDKLIIEARDLGHPLIDKNTRVANDFAIGEKGTLVILTGPNMAGKSTFLRTVGVNLILGMNGAPVCASEFIFTPVKIFSSMRTSDSLQKNESYFYAELCRLRTLKERLLADDNMFILLDEILKGTNSRDKHTGSKLFIKQLVKMNGTGLIATHDVELGNMEQDFPEHISNKCFEVEIDGEHISFDYLLREGMTKKMNAAYLMKQMKIV
jgi:DNA mismatch repair ATPase MutS